MIVTGVTLTPALAAWLRAAHDDGAAPLWCCNRRTVDGVPDNAEGISVLRADGSALTPTEEREVRALLAAHAAEPLRMPTAGTEEPHK